MTAAPKTALIVVSTTAHQPGMIELARLLESSGRWRIKFILYPNTSIPRLAGQFEAYSWNGFYFTRLGQSSSNKHFRIHPNFIKAVSVFMFPVTLALACFILLFGLLINTPPLPYKAPLASRISRNLILYFGGGVWQIPKPKNHALYVVYRIIFRRFWDVLGIKYLYQATREWVAANKIDVLILPEFNILYDHEAMFAAGRDEGLKTIVFPYTLCGHQEWCEAALRGGIGADTPRLLDSLASVAFPRWVVDYKGNKLCFPTKKIITCQMLTVDPTVPWVTNSVEGVVTALEDDITRGFYQREGVDTSKWKIIGSLTHDKMFNIMQDRPSARMRLLSDFGVEQCDGIVVVAMPPNQFDDFSQVASESAARMYRQLIERLINTIETNCGPGWRVYACPHPRSDVESLKGLETCKTILTERKLDGLIPLADIYVAVSSATIRWAISCGVPVVNFDAYQYCYQDYMNYPGVIHVSQFDDFASSISQLTNDADFYKKVCAQQRRSASSMGQFDGLSFARIIDLVERAAV